MSRETKKEKILAVSKSLIIEKGYQGTSLRDIASNAGVTMGAIYHHFRNKEEIYLNVLKENNIVEYLEKIAALILDGNFPRNIEGVGRVIWQAARENKDFFKLIYVDILEFQGKNVKPLAMEFRSVTSQIAENILNEKIERGEIVPLHPHIILRCLTDLFLHYYLEEMMLDKSLASQTGVSEDELLKQIGHILLHGILIER